jgi:preprotein translocase subunit SecG
MKTGLLILQIVVSVILIASILLQAQGSGLGASWGGGGETYHTRRGLERVIFYLTIVCCVIFTVSSVALLIVR